MQILVVDDDLRMLASLRRSLRRQCEDWSMTYVGHPEAAWEALLETPYDAVVTDVRMPGISGLDLLDRIQQCEKTRQVPVVVLTGLNDRVLKQQALEHGAADLLNKPVDAGQLIARLRNVLETKRRQDDLRAANNSLAEQVERQRFDMVRSRMSVICRLGMAAEFRDEDTGNHVIRVGCFSRAVAVELGRPRPFLEMLLLAAPLHDIGKIGIPDSVLLKPGPLDDAEWAVMQRHCEIGECILREQSKVVVPLLDWYAGDSPEMKNSLVNHDPVLETAAAIAMAHHERWDGSGYPQGLAGEEIPLEARIVAVADVFDALISDRPYRPARPEEEVLSIMGNAVGSHFDPTVYAAFLRALPEIRAVRSRFADDVIVFPQTEGATR
ncbi:MAG: HD domain-containing phosphohydrolase [Thermoguttaceae bacterium]